MHFMTNRRIDKDKYTHTFIGGREGEREEMVYVWVSQIYVYIFFIQKYVWLTAHTFLSLSLSLSLQ